MRTVLALFVVIFIVAGVGAFVVMQTELRYLAAIVALGFAVVSAGLGGVIDEVARLKK